MSLHLHFHGPLPWAQLGPWLQQVTNQVGGRFDHLDTRLREGFTHMSELSDQIMQMLADEDAGLAAINTNLDGIAADIEALKNSGGAGQAELQAVLNKLQGTQQTVQGLQQRTQDLDAQNP